MGRTRGFEDEAEDVLRGRQATEVGRLFELIHEVNPSGREVSAGETRRRYALKARLQSLLIARFGDVLAAAAEGGAEEIVSLRHRSGTRDGCHAAVAQLDVEARAWVRRRLDEQAVDPAPVEGQDGVAADLRGPASGHGVDGDGRFGDGVSLDACLRRAGEALEAFDYEAAQEALRAALTVSRGATRAALPLVELLVEQLGDDEGALALSDDLAPEARAHPVIHRCLALAAGRLGAEERLRRLLKGLDDEAAGAACAAMARHALQRGDEAQADRWLTETRVRWAGRGELQALAGERAALRARRRAPEEQVLLGLLAAGRVTEATVAARRLLERWPESEVARRLVREMEERERATRAGALLDAAEQLLARGEPDEVARLVREASALGGERSALATRLEQARRAQAREAYVQRLAEVESRLDEAASLTTAERGSALVRFLGLTADERATLRRRRPEPVLEWAEAARAAGFKPAAAVEAALALERAEHLLAAHEPQPALDLLKEHERALGGVRRRAELMEAARGSLAQRAHETAAALLEEAEGRLGAGELVACEAALTRCERTRLNADERERAVVVEGRIASLRRLAQGEAQFRSALADGDLVTARSLAEEQAGRVGEGDRPRWRAECERLEAEIGRAWRIQEWRDEGPDAAAPVTSEAGDPHVDLDLPSAASAAVWLDGECRRLLTCSAYERWLTIQVAESHSLRVRAVFVLQTPESLGELTWGVDGGGLWLIGSTGYLLIFDWVAGRVVTWRALGAFGPADAEVGLAALVPGTHQLWVELESREDDLSATVVIDTQRWRESRRFGPRVFFEPVVGGERATMACCRLEGGGVSLHEGHGRTITTRASGFENVAVALHPLGEEAGFVMTSGRARLGDPDAGEPTEETPGAGRLALVEWRPDGSVSPAVTVEDSAPELTHMLATARAQRRTFLSHLSEDGRQHLESYVPTPEGPRLDYRVAAPPRVGLVQDAAAREVFALFHDPRAGGSLSSVRLTGLPPEWPASMRSLRFDRVPSDYDLNECVRPRGAVNAGALALQQAWKDCSPAQLAEMLAEDASAEQVESPDEAVTLFAAYYAGQTLGADARALAPIRERLDQLATTQPHLLVLRAHEAALARDWQRVLDLLQAPPSPELDAGGRQHRAHLLGLAQVWGGDWAVAHRTLAAAAGMEDGRCRLEGLIDYTRRFSSPPKPEEWDATQSISRQLAGAVLCAATALATGDREGARRAIDRRLVWSQRELQSLGMLAAVYLELPDPLPAPLRLRKLRVLAGLCEARTRRWPRLHELVLPTTVSRDATALAALEQRCRQWLEGFTLSA